jgi:hypothetical protein
MYTEDNFVRTRYYDKCVRCAGLGKTLEQTSYYDKDLVDCCSCDGYGLIFREEKIITRYNQPFLPARD